MKTDELVAMLASGAEAVSPDSGARRCAVALGVGLLGAGALMAMLLGVRHDLAQAAFLGMFWVKLGYAATLAAAGVFAMLRLSHPGVGLGGLPATLTGAIVAMWALAAIALLEADAEQRGELVFGRTWETCPFFITLLSVPVFAALVWAMRGLAPTRLRLAGAFAGFASGATAAIVYSLHCPELAPPFIALWYSLGVLLPTLAGAWLGPRLLRW